MTRSRTVAIAAVAWLVGLMGCDESTEIDPPPVFDAETTLSLVNRLSSDDLKGRRAGTAESAQARELVVRRMIQLGLRPYASEFEKSFTYQPEDQTEELSGVNVIGHLRGTEGSNLAMVVSAHYDHLGEISGRVYNGADDNASGVAGMLAIAEYFSNHPPSHDIIFVAFDAEEEGQRGSKSFVASPPVPIERIALNLNLDMISRGDNELLWISGVAHTPGLKPIVAAVVAQAPVRLRTGYDSVDAPADWTLQSDHAAFFRAGLPHIYLGVEDHPDYHQPSDDFEKIDQAWFLKSVETAVMMAIEADARLDEIAALQKSGPAP